MTDAENNKEVQQIIPYILIKNQFGEFYVAKRLSNSTEDRLHNQISLGFGGHINKEDGYKEPLFKCAFRELFEELKVKYAEILIKRKQARTRINELEN